MSYGIFWLTQLGYSLLLVTTITAMASTAFKGANGRYPAKLEDLFPDFIDRISLDPFDGKPLKMKPVEGGVELYSVGRHPKIAKLRTENPTHFYLGRETYEKYRVKPSQE